MVIKESGISCVIAKTFARIFYRNAINIGLAILECPEASEKIQSGDEVAIDFDTGLITNLTKGETYQANPFPAFIKEIIQAGGLMADIKKRQEHNPMEYKLAVIPGDGIGPTWWSRPSWSWTRWGEVRPHLPLPKGPGRRLRH